MNAMIGSSLLLSSEGYQIERSVRLRSSATAYLTRTPSVAGNQKTWTWSGWVKRGTLNADQTIFCARQVSTSTPYVFFGFNVTTDILAYNSSSGGALYTTQVFRDPSAWYHIVYSVDTTQATAANRIKLYVNGVQITSFSTATYPALNADTGVNTAIAHWIGAVTNGAGTIYTFLDGYLTEINFIDGQALTPSSFGETDAVTGVWKPKKYTGTYGTNGFYLNFADNSSNTAATIGKDSSGNGNNWTPNNISVTAGVTYDSMLDVPTQWADGGNGRGNYAVLNPLAPSSYVTLSAGNLTATGNTATNSGMAVASIGTSTGKYVWEETITTVFGNFPGVGATTVILQDGNGQNPGASNTLGFYYRANGTIYKNSASLVGTYSTFSNGDIVRFELDADALTCAVYKNNTLIVTITGLTAGTFYPSNVNYNSSVTNSNFGQRPFANTPSSGFKALNTLNLPTPTILKGNQYFDATLWNGQNTTLSVTNSGAMQPDFVWIKKRNGATDHNLTDAVRGTNRNLISNSTAAEDTVARLTSFDTGGFTLAGAFDNTNISGSTYVGWQWKEGATQGFDIVTYTGDGTSPRNISHSLGVVPAMVIVKSRNAVASWMVKHQNLSSNNNVFLESSAAQSSPSNGYIQNLTSSSTFGVVNGGGGVANVNANGTTYVAYLFAEVAGFSKFGSYTGNGSADGPFVFCGFRPRFILIKESTPNARGWRIFDTARSPFNQAGLTLSPNTADAEDTGSGLYNQMDILSNGFKLRAGTNSEPTNESGATYIYAAFSENPAKYSLAR